MEKQITPVEPQTLATLLHTVEAKIAELEEIKDKYREELTESLKHQGVRRVDLKNGDSYILYPKNNLVIKDKLAAKKWGLENPEARMKLDTSAALEVATSGKLKWANVEVSEHLRISRSKETKDA